MADKALSLIRPLPTFLSSNRNRRSIDDGFGFLLAGGTGPRGGERDQPRHISIRDSQGVPQLGDTLAVCTGLALGFSGWLYSPRDMLPPARGHRCSEIPRLEKSLRARQAGGHGPPRRGRPVIGRKATRIEIGSQLRWGPLPHGIPYRHTSFSRPPLLGAHGFTSFGARALTVYRLRA